MDERARPRTRYHPGAHGRADRPPRVFRGTPAIRGGRPPLRRGGPLDRLLRCPLGGGRDPPVRLGRDEHGWSATFPVTSSETPRRSPAAPRSCRPAPRSTPRCCRSRPTTSIGSCVEDSELSDLILRTFLARRSALIEGDYSSIKVVGSRYARDTHRIREFLTRNSQPYAFLDWRRTPGWSSCSTGWASAPTRRRSSCTGTCAFTRIRATIEMAHSLGFDVLAEVDLCDVVVVGAGPAGLAASGLRGVGGALGHDDRRGHSRRPGGDQLEDRELPRLPHRDLGAGSWRSGPTPRRSSSARGWPTRSRRSRSGNTGPTTRSSSPTAGPSGAGRW